MSDLDLLRQEIWTCEMVNTDGRIVRRNSPERLNGPRVALAGCAEGAVCACHVDLDDALAREVETFVAHAPASDGAERLPEWTAELAEQVGVDPATLGGGPAWLLPHGLAFDSGCTIIAGESPEGAALVARFEADGMPQTLVDAGYVDVGELWAPWCAAMVSEEVAALCCAARVNDVGGEVGLYSFPPHRGRGHGAAVTAAWSRLPSLAGKPLFYSTQYDNHSSRRVTQRLGLRQLGWTVAIGD